MKISVLGAATTKFGELWSRSPRDLVMEAVNEALDDSKEISLQDIEAVYVGNMLSGTLGGQDHLGAFFAEELGLHVPAMKVEGACASGGLAIHAGVTAVSSGIYENVLVVGIEKMTDFKPEEVAEALMGAGSDPERDAGASFPSLYALMARVHMEKYGTTEEDMAAVAVKNHYHASLNSHAQFTFPVTMEKVMESPVVSSPLKLLDCSPISDGAAAVILSSKIKKTGRNIFIVGSAVATDSLGLAERDDLTTIYAAKEAARKAYKMSGVGPNEIDVAEVHDCFTIAEIIAMEDLGFFGKGEAARAVRLGQTRLGGRPVINTSGGLKACGHPVGATGVKQVVEIYRQLKGIAGKKQVKGAKLGLTHNVGGSGATAVVNILKG
ncbi:thiolase domain-containing protein [Patescibacteria group bacterium]|nr:thiolase domain-containing protein [Patescibacteria group bacterium]MCL5798294.1 thiolase domain-containing protein [Patescibacteria group bacterium]